MAISLVQMLRERRTPGMDHYGSEHGYGTLTSRAFMHWKPARSQEQHQKKTPGGTWGECVTREPSRRGKHEVMSQTSEA